MGLLLDKITLGNSPPTIDQVTGIMSSLGHQLQEELASKELWGELGEKLQTGDNLCKGTERRKLSEARVLDGETFMTLHNAPVVKDERKKKLGG